MSEDMEPQIKNIWKSSGGGYLNNSLKVLQVVPYSEINLWVWGTTIFLQQSCYVLCHYNFFKLKKIIIGNLESSEKLHRRALTNSKWLYKASR